MKQFDIARLSDLSPGDRFYFPNNKSKVYTFVNQFSEGYKIKYSYCDNSAHDTFDNKRVIFLRHKKIN